MKIIATIHLYSGFPSPQTELSNEDSIKIINMLNNANESSLDHSISYKLPPNGYLINWIPDSEPYPSINIHVANGTICIRNFALISYVKDNVGLEDYLKQLLEPL